MQDNNRMVWKGLLEILTFISHLLLLDKLLDFDVWLFKSLHERHDVAVTNLFDLSKNGDLNLNRVSLHDLQCW